MVRFLKPKFLLIAVKVLLSCCGIGLGHANRSLAIANRLEEEGFDVYLVSYGDAYKLLRSEKGRKVFRIPSWSWVEGRDGSLNFIDTLFSSPSLAMKFIRQARKLNKLVNRIKPDLIISDSEFASLAIAKIKKIPSIYITNWLRVKEPTFGFKLSLSFLEDLTEAIIVPDFPKPYTIVKENLKAPREILRKTKFVGIISRKKPEEVVGVKKEEIFKENKPIVFISISGPGKSKEIWKFFVDKLRHLITKNFILTLGSLWKRKVEKEENILIFNWVKAEERYKFLKVADLLVSRAGFGTISDAIKFGKKTILIPQENQPEQIMNAKSIEEKGLGIMLPQKDISMLITLFDKLLEDKKISKRVEKYRKIAERFDGVERAVECIKSF